MSLSRDEQGIKEVLEKLDTHSINQETFKLPSRLIAKIYLFRTIFRGSGWAFSVDNAFKHVSDDPIFWENINTMFYKKYLGLDRLHMKWAQTVVERKPIIGPTGREWFIEPKFQERKIWQNHKTETTATLVLTQLSNLPVQGTSADIMSIARVTLSQR
ncbi:MAG: hypothetical protein ACRCST_04390, partial [Turicibacter sp.]